MLLKSISTFLQSQYGKLLRQKSEDPAADISTFHNTPQDPNADYKDVDKLPKYASPCGDNNVTDSASNSSLSESTTEVTQNGNSEEKKNGKNVSKHSETNKIIELY